MALIDPYPGHPIVGDAFDPVPIKAKLDAIFQGIQAFDGSQIVAGSVAAAAMATAINPVTRSTETTYDYVASGLNWSVISGLNGTMSSGVVYIQGIRVPVSAVGSKAFTASVDTYIDVDFNGNLTYITNTTNTAAPALTANSIRIGIAIAAASLTSFNQGDPAATFPVVSSVVMSVQDSLGNLINPRDPNRKLLGYRQIITDFTTTATPTITDITGISVPFIAPGNRKVMMTLVVPVFYSSAIATTIIRTYAREASTQLADAYYTMAGSQYALTMIASGITTPSAGLHTYVGSVSQSAAGTLHTDGATASPVYLKVELE